MSCLRLNNNCHSQAIDIDSNVLKKVKSKVKSKVFSPNAKRWIQPRKEPSSTDNSFGLVRSVWCNAGECQCRFKSQIRARNIETLLASGIRASAKQSNIWLTCRLDWVTHWYNVKLALMMNGFRQIRWWSNTLIIMMFVWAASSSTSSTIQNSNETIKKIVQKINYIKKFTCKDSLQHGHSPFGFHFK
jgi:hypothetical protein